MRSKVIQFSIALLCFVFVLTALRYWQFGTLSLGNPSGAALTVSAIGGGESGELGWFGAIGVLLVLIVIVGGIIIYLRRQNKAIAHKSFDFSGKHGRRDLIPIKVQ